MPGEAAPKYSCLGQRTLETDENICGCADCSACCWMVWQDKLTLSFPVSTVVVVGGGMWQQQSWQHCVVWPFHSFNVEFLLFLHLAGLTSQYHYFNNDTVMRYSLGQCSLDIVSQKYITDHNMIIKVSKRFWNETSLWCNIFIFHYPVWLC